MPPKKKENTEAAETNSEPNIEAYELPRALVTRIAKSELPDNVKFSKETVSALVKGSTVFINYLAGTAHDVAASKQHKSVSASDVLKALELLSFGDMVPELQIELQAYRDSQKGKKATANRSKAKEKSGPTISIPARRPSNPSSAASSRPPSRMDVDEDSGPAKRPAQAEEEEEEGDVVDAGDSDE